MRTLKLLVLTSAVMLPALPSAQTTPAPPAMAAPQLIDAALAAMGGGEHLLAIKSLTLESIGHEWALEQSERPEGPWLSSYIQKTEIRDYAGNRQWTETSQRNWNSPKWSPALALVIAGDVAARTNAGRWAPALTTDVAAWADTQALAPERLLLTAKAASDLRVVPDETVQRVRQNVLAFTRPGQRLKLFLNAWTHLPTQLEVTKNDHWSIWGDIVERRAYSFWTLEKNGVMYPRQTTVEWNGFPFGDETVHALAMNDAVDDAKFAIPEDTKAAYARAAPRPIGMSSVMLDETKAVALTDTIVQFPSAYNVTIVKQPDGIVILEATTTSGFSAQVIAAATKRFPNLPIKAVVTTSDAWPHLGGIREYAARGIPIYALDLNVSILTRVINAPHTFAPDALSKTPKAPVFRPVSARTVLGNGDSRIEIIPVRGEFGERMMLVSFPAAHLLYSSDLIQRDRARTSFFMMAMPAEVVDAVAREGLTNVEKVFGMHLAPTPWTEVVDAVKAARGR